MAELGKTDRLLLIGGVVFILVFTGLIFAVNSWIRQSLQEMQIQIPQTASSVVTPEESKRHAISSTAIGGPLVTRNKKCCEDKATIKERKVEIIREAPILDKVLNE